MVTLLIDNYDSYTFNLYQLIATVSGQVPLVVQNDEYGGIWDELCKHLIPGISFQHIVISPGPGTPEQAKDVGLSVGAARDGRVPVLGVCLGHQLLGFVNGARIVRAKEPMHGRISDVFHDETHPMFANIPSPFKVVRYHSLIVDESSCAGTSLKVVARASSGEIMALEVENNNTKAWGVQFHPESISSEYGETIIKNFIGCEVGPNNNNNNNNLTMPEKVIVNNRNVDGQVRNKVRVEKLHDMTGINHETTFEQLFGKKTTRFWLDTATKAQLGRFSYMGQGSELIEFYVHPEDRNFVRHEEHEPIDFKPRIELREYRENDDGEWEITKQGPRCVDIFDYLDERTTQLRTNLQFSIDSSWKPMEEWDLPFPFATGFVGYFGYGLRRLCGVKSTNENYKHLYQPYGQEDLKQQRQQRQHGKGQPEGGDKFVPESTFLLVDRLIVWDHVENSGYIVVLYDDNTEQKQFEWLSQTRAQLKENSTFQGEEEEMEADFQSLAQQSAGPNDLLQARVSDDMYKQQIETCLELIRAGETYEVCLTRQMSTSKLKLDQSSTFEVYKTLRRLNPAPYAAFFQVHNVQTLDDDGRRHANFAVCCSSPERFLRIDQHGEIESKPIKGTIRRGRAWTEDGELAKQLETSVKDRSENLMIVDLVRNDIGRVCEIGSVNVPKLMQIESFASVHQMVSTIRGKVLRNKSTLQAIRAGFPGGSMTGAPKLRTMQIIDELEPQERGVYSGALGFISLNGASDLNIVIRTAVLTPDGVSVGTGGAIVALSNPDEEVDETLLKAARLQATLMKRFNDNH